MPNLIFNEVTVSNESLDDIFRLTHLLRYCNRGIFAGLISPASQTEAARIEAWGTATEIYPPGCEGNALINIDDSSDEPMVQFSFVTESSPPRKFLEQLVRMGFEVKCHYQSARVYIGMWDQGRDECGFRSLV
jgi:hypothetical protein